MTPTSNLISRALLLVLLCAMASAAVVNDRECPACPTPAPPGRVLPRTARSPHSSCSPRAQPPRCAHAGDALLAVRAAAINWETVRQPGWDVRGWEPSEPDVCQWSGVKCEDGHVVHL